MRIIYEEKNDGLDGDEQKRARFDGDHSNNYYDHKFSRYKNAILLTKAVTNRFERITRGSNQ